MKNYKHIFFDLDHTLWDFERNSAEVLSSLYDHYELFKLGTFTTNDFVEKFRTVNLSLWSAFHKGSIDKTTLRATRFKIIFEHFRIKNQKIEANLEKDYIELCPKKGNVFPFTHDTLNYLKKKYKLHIITNGFPEIQYTKLTSANLHNYFLEIITSEKAGCYKPNKKIFEYALNTVGAECNDCLMIGDDLEADILGAKNALLDHIYFNPQKVKHLEKITYEIHCLSELMKIL